ncbi:glycoside hydrolase family 15 protein [Marinicrinis sediminis]|uniref:Glycoside hydrolase family 15 protein n=1 Tax=Marinicrinis sediminis TaxID=1652465 RepID=A0ABW5R907_9BACL
MTRHFALGNGKMLVNLDDRGMIRDVYYPYVGQWNHVGGYPFRIGIWTDGQFSWLTESVWEVNRCRYVTHSLVTDISLKHEVWQLEIEMQAGVHQRDCIFLNGLKLINHGSKQRNIRLYFHQDLSIDESEVGDTAAYYPDLHSLFHYKKNRYFMFNGNQSGLGMNEYSTGIKRFHQAEGTWRDAENGKLSCNPIAQGSVDSAIAFHVEVEAGQSAQVHYWFSAGSQLDEVVALDQYVRENRPGALLDRIRIYWQKWSSKCEMDAGDLEPSLLRLYRQSLLLVRTQINTNGAIVAANDSEILAYNRDHYSYMWPRDGALIAHAMSQAGYHGTIVPFFHFCARHMHPSGYLHHKYNPDGTIGSSWHPYIQNGEKQLPIQEDETALVLHVLWKDYERHKVIELPQSLYKILIRKAAAFLETYWLKDLSLPYPSYDLWEERYGIHTFTCAAVYAGLLAASNFCNLFGDLPSSEQFRERAEEVQNGIIKHLWNEREQRFARGLIQIEGTWKQDLTPESSIIGLYLFEVLPVNDSRLIQTIDQLRSQLQVNTDIGGIARYSGDSYFLSGDLSDRVPGNPWIICTLWFAMWDMEVADSLESLRQTKEHLHWTVRHALSSDVLPEQLHPYEGTPLSVAPLTWSHATYLMAVHTYIRRYQELSSSITEDI